MSTLRRAAGPGSARGFTLVEVLVALMIVAIGLAALLVAVSGAARTSGYLRDKTVAQWIALNRLVEVRINTSKFSQNTDTGEVYMANRAWHYDTRYFDTSIATMKRISVRVYIGDAKTKGNPLAEAIGFLGSAIAVPGSSNGVQWNTGMTPETAVGAATAPGNAVGAAPTATSPTTVTPPTQAPTPAPTAPPTP